MKRDWKAYQPECPQCRVEHQGRMRQYALTTGRTVRCVECGGREPSDEELAQLAWQRSSDPRVARGL